MERHLKKKRVPSGVLFWAPTVKDATQQGGKLRSRGPSPIRRERPTSQGRVHVLHHGEGEGSRGRNEAGNISGQHSDDHQSSFNYLQVFPHIPPTPGENEPESTLGSEQQTELCLPLLSASVNVSVDGTVACTDLMQKFMNPSDFLIPEARHSFPLYYGAVVTSFECIIDDKRYLRGCVKPTKVAIDEFQKAKTSRKRQAAALLQEVTPEMFETALGNIPPRAVVTVKLKYVHELEVVVMKHEKAEGVAITVPSSIAPSYGDTSHRTHQDYPLSAAQLPQDGLTIGIQVADSGTIEGWSIESGHDVQYQGTRPMPKPVIVGGLAEVAKLQAQAPETQRTQSVWHYSSDSPALKKDFILVVAMHPEHRLRSRAVVEPADSRGLAAMMISLRPTDLFGSAVRPHAFTGELLFLLDRSGSMGVAAYRESTVKIDTMRAGMELALSGLPDTCAFNIISFGGEVRGMWPQSRPASDGRNMAHARDYLAQVEADMRGTEVLQALRAATASRLQTRESTQVILITDGEVYEPQQPILEFVWETRRQHGADKIRFFTLGIGDHVSHRVMESIGELGGGYCDVVDVVKRPYWEDRLNRMLRSSMEPTSWSCEIALGPGYHRESLATTSFLPPKGEVRTGPSQPASVPYVQAPYPVPPLQPYRYKSLFFLLDLRGGNVPPSVTITTTTPGAKRKEYTLAVESTIFNTQTIHHLAAKAVLVGLENEARRGVEGIDTNTVRANGEYLGTEYDVASTWTSFVAVESDAEEQDDGVEVDIYAARMLELTADDLTLESDSTSSSGEEEEEDPLTWGLQFHGRPPGMAIPGLGSLNQHEPPQIAKDGHGNYNVVEYEYDVSDWEPVISSSQQQASEEEDTAITWRSAVRCQEDGGLFVLNEPLRTNLQGHFCDTTAARLHDRLRELTSSPVLAIAHVVDTLMMMSYFETHLAAERDSWDLIMGKAKRAVLVVLGFDEDEDTAVAELEEILVRSVVHAHFNEAVYSTSVERQSADGEHETGARIKTCPICDVNFDAEAWPECGDRAFVCCDDGCYKGLAGGRREFDNWDLFWEHQVEAGHLSCP
ncbi:hypothetical protein C8A01DRAFT_14425 [Parachaetomium inaequale]|uniref:VWFA domain-containing protein n=1 Tax=Parachaetomium inaequale TaxID=2588326 RepID=A0AAN6SSV6_9PEZI|nr:hypothetical protein C8A01DRAFT_14425 [Parachaetomium inaequale]